MQCIRNPTTQVIMHQETYQPDGQLEAAHAHIDNDGYDMVKWGAAGQPKLDLSDQLKGCSITSIYMRYPTGKW